MTVDSYFTRRSSGGKAKHQLSPEMSVAFYPMLFRGKAKRSRATARNFTRSLPGEGKTFIISTRRRILPDALPGEGKTPGALSNIFFNFTRCTSGGKAKLLVRSIRKMHFTRCSSGGKAKHGRGSSRSVLCILPDALPGGRQNLAAGWRVRLDTSTLSILLHATAAHANPPLIWLRPVRISSNFATELFQSRKSLAFFRDSWDSY